MVNQPVGNSEGSVSRASARRALLWAALLSLSLHVVLTPVAGWLGMLAWALAPRTAEDTSPPELLHSIPITWLGDDEAVEPEAEPAPALTAPVALIEPARPVPAAPVAPAPAATPQPLSPLAAPAKPAEPPSVPQRNAPTEPEPPSKPTKSKERPVKPVHPIKLAGISSKILDDNANVNLLLLTERVREHPLGARIGKVLVNFPQWRSFFASGEIDPVRDLNRILLVGPEFRRSADVVAIVQHRLERELVRKAVDELVQRPPQGRWLNSKMTLARAYADRAERLFAMPSSSLLVVAPPHLERQLTHAPPTRFPAPPGNEALVLHVRSPSRSLRGLPLELPDSIAWLRLDVTALEGGAALLRMTAEDADARSATAHARSLASDLNALTNPDLGALGALLGVRSIALIDKIDLQARGTRISGEVQVRQQQLDRLLGYVEGLVEQWSQRRGLAVSPAVPEAAPTAEPVPTGKPSRVP